MDDVAEDINKLFKKKKVKKKETDIVVENNNLLNIKFGDNISSSFSFSFLPLITFLPSNFTQNEIFLMLIRILVIILI
jgi:hypothetical protein